jgi:hypothetical protein
LQLILVLALDAPAQHVILRNWGGVRIFQENNRIQIVITTEIKTDCGIAVSDPDPRVRLTAVRKLTDKRVLAQVARQDSEFTVRLAALERVSDDRLLDSIESSITTADVRAAAVRRLAGADDLNALFRDPNPRVRRAVVETTNHPPSDLRRLQQPTQSRGSRSCSAQADEP